MAWKHPGQGRWASNLGEARDFLAEVESLHGEGEYMAALAKHADVFAEATVAGPLVHLVPSSAEHDERDVLRAILDSDIRVRSFKERVPDLHEVFLELTRGEVS